MSVLPGDFQDRERFASDLRTNFSVRASAGSGKTTAIASRIVSMVLSPNALELLPKLVVVTYTVKAAEEMKQRARARLLEMTANGEIPADRAGFLNRAYFGTIHSFCLMLLNRFGFWAGMGTNADSHLDEEILWHEFLRVFDDTQWSVPEEEREMILCRVDYDQVFELAHELSLRGLTGLERTLPTTLPIVDPKALDAQNPPHRVSKVKAEQWTRKWRDFCKAWSNPSTPYVPPLKSADTGGAEFIAAFRACHSPVKEWCQQATCVLAVDIARQYEKFRWAKGQLTFQDQITGARHLLEHALALNQIRDEGFIVLLDEAQDTDPVQFEILTEITRPENAPLGSWLEKGETPPVPGRFCMVGDPQQSIYRDRSSLAYYEKYHRALTASGDNDLTFNVTFRCPQSIVNLINAVFPRVLNGENGQTTFSPLSAKPGAGEGQAVRIHLTGELLNLGPDPGLNTDALVQEEAKYIARWIATKGLAALRANCWGDVAVLLPRNDWFKSFKAAFEREGIKCQNVSGRSNNAEQPAYLWLTALIKVMARPHDSFEIVGVLREVFGVSDEALFHHRKKGGDFTLDQATGVSEVLEPLVLLRALHTSIAMLPLRAAIQLVLERTLLRERLETIDSENDYESVLDQILVSASVREDEGFDIAQFAEDLELRKNNPRPDEIGDHDAIQCVSTYKAKGLEWKAVVLPLLGRCIGNKTPLYPRIVSVPDDYKNPGVQWDADSYDSIAGPLLKEEPRRNFQDLQRLFYVAMTRAVETLVVVDDLEIFGPSKKSTWSFLNCCSGGLELPALNLSEYDRFFSPDVSRKSSVKEKNFKQFEFELPSGFSINKAIEASGAPWKKERPSQHAVERQENKYTDEGEIDAPKIWPVDYGLWWHSVMEEKPWCSPDFFDLKFDRWITRLQNPVFQARGKKDLEHLVQSELVKDLTGLGTQCFTEVPYFCQPTPTTWQEGIIDLVYVRKGECTLLDWKTDSHIQDSTILVERYEHQLKAYAKALRGTGLNVTRLVLYSTELGQLVEMPET